MGRGGEKEVDAGRLLYGRPIPRLRNGDIAVEYRLEAETLFSVEQLKNRTVKSVSTSPNGSVAIALDTPRLARGSALLSHQGTISDPGDHFDFPDDNELLHQGLDPAHDLLLWRNRGRKWVGSIASHHGLTEPIALAPASAQIATIDEYPRMAWFEISGGQLALKEEDPAEPFNLRQAVASYPSEVSGSPDNLRALYDRFAGCLIAVWSEEGDQGKTKIKSWVEHVGTATEVILPETGPIDIHQLETRRGYPCVVWSPRGGSTSYLTDSESGETAVLATDHPRPQVVALDSGELYVAYLEDHGSGKRDLVLDRYKRGSFELEDSWVDVGQMTGDFQLFARGHREVGLSYTTLDIGTTLNLANCSSAGLEKPQPIASGSAIDLLASRGEADGRGSLVYLDYQGGAEVKRLDLPAP